MSYIVKVKQTQIVATPAPGQVPGQPTQDRIGTPPPEERAFVVAAGEEVTQISFVMPVDQAPRLGDEMEVDVRIRGALRAVKASAAV